MSSILFPKMKENEPMNLSTKVITMFFQSILYASQVMVF